MHNVAGSGNVVTVKQLVAARSDANVADKGGKTALHYMYGASKSWSVVVEQLLATQVNMVDNDSKTTLHYAKMHNRSKVVALITSALAPPAAMPPAAMPRRTPSAYSICSLEKDVQKSQRSSV